MRGYMLHEDRGDTRQLILVLSATFLPTWWNIVKLTRSFTRTKNVRWTFVLYVLCVDIFVERNADSHSATR